LSTQIGLTVSKVLGFLYFDTHEGEQNCYVQ